MSLENTETWVQTLCKLEESECQRNAPDDLEKFVDRSAWFYWEQGLSQSNASPKEREDVYFFKNYTLYFNLI